LRSIPSALIALAFRSPSLSVSFFQRSIAALSELDNLWANLRWAYAQPNPIYIYNPSAASAGSSDRVSSINIKTVRVRSISRKISFPPHAREAVMNIHVSWRAASSGHRREIAATLSPDTIGEGTMDRSGEWHSLARVPRHFSRRNVTVSPPRRGQRPWRLRGWLVGRSGYEGADGPAGSAIPGLKRSDCRHHRVMPCLSWQASHVMNPRGVLAASWIRDSKRRHAVTARVSKRNCNLQFSSAIRQETLVISERPTTAGEGERKRDGGEGEGTTIASPSERVPRARIGSSSWEGRSV